MDRNICKWVMKTERATLIPRRFILESNPETMRMETVLKEHRVLLVSGGSGVFHCGERIASLSRGDLRFAFRGERFFAEPGENCEYMYIDFEGERAEELFARFHIRAGVESPGKFEGLIPLWQESLTRASAQTIDLAAESIVLYTFSRFSAEEAGKSDLLEKMLAYLQEHFTDHEFTLADVAEKFSYNPKYVSHLFKTKMKVGYTGYVRSLRLSYAVSLFQHGLDSVRNVALLSGFDDPMYFSTVFKREIGVPPAEYAKRLKNPRAGDESRG